MIPPGPMGYGNPNEMYGPSGPSGASGASGASGPSQVGGFGSGGPPSSSFSGPSGHSNPGPYGAYGYSYGFVPQPYPPPYNPNSVWPFLSFFFFSAGFYCRNPLMSEPFDFYAESTLNCIFLFNISQPAEHTLFTSLFFNPPIIIIFYYP